MAPHAGDEAVRGSFPCALSPHSGIWAPQRLMLCGAWVMSTSPETPCIRQMPSVWEYEPNGEVDER